MAEKTLSMREGELGKDIEIATWQALKEARDGNERALQLVEQAQEVLNKADERLDAAKTFLNTGLLIGLLGLAALILMILEKV